MKRSIYYLFIVYISNDDVPFWSLRIISHYGRNILQNSIIMGVPLAYE